MDISKPGVMSLLADTIRTAIDNNSATDNPPKFSWRVSPNSLGDECVARNWFKFRWVVKAQKPGRINRIFKRGNGREDYFTALLRRAGWEVRDYAERLVMRSGDGVYKTLDWEDEITPGYEDVHQDPWHITQAHQQDKWLLKQWKLAKFDGHMTGYSDGRARHPELTDNQWIGVEYKTYNTRRFSSLYNKRSVKVTDFGYYIQKVIYLKEFDLPYGLFLAENKNDDDIYCEVILRDDAIVEHYMKTAHTIVTSKARPARYAESETHHECKQCDFAGVCHRGEPVEINCRSCQHCSATDKGKFHCSKWNAIIPGETEILAACPHHLPIV